MKKVLIPLIILFLSGCGGDSDGDPPSTPSSVPAGIYEGTITPNGGTPDLSVALITSAGDVAILDVNTIEALVGTISGPSLTGTIYSSTAVPATAQVTSVSGNSISGTYTSSLGGGTFALVADPNLYNRASSLSKLVGIWVDSFFTAGIGTSTWVIQADGSFSISTTLGCTGIGTFSIIDPSKNEYNLSLTISNCAGLNGTYSGIAATSDTLNTDDSISLVFNSATIAGVSEPIKQ